MALIWSYLFVACYRNVETIVYSMFKFDRFLFYFWYIWCYHGYCDTNMFRKVCRRMRYDFMSVFSNHTGQLGWCINFPLFLSRFTYVFPIFTNILWKCITHTLYLAIDSIMYYDNHELMYYICLWTG